MKISSGTTNYVTMFPFWPPSPLRSPADIVPSGRSTTSTPAVPCIALAYCPTMLVIPNATVIYFLLNKFLCQPTYPGICPGTCQGIAKFIPEVPERNLMVEFTVALHHVLGTCCSLWEGVKFGRGGFKPVGASCSNSMYLPPIRFVV